MSDNKFAIDCEKDRRGPKTFVTEESKVELKTNPCLRIYDLFSHMSDCHGLTLTDTEMHDIIDVCAKYVNADSKPTETEPVDLDALI